MSTNSKERDNRTLQMNEVELKKKVQNEKDIDRGDKRALSEI